MSARWNSNEKAPPGTPKTWDTWTDVIGQKYGPGDKVCVAVINGRSPQMVIGEVIRINRLDSQGREHVTTWWELDPDTPPEIRVMHDGSTRTIPARKELSKPSCTVTVQPMLDARGFYRSGPTTQAKPVTYQFWQNVIKVPV